MLDNQQNQRRPLTPYQQRQALELHAAGAPINKISKAVGISAPIIRKFLRAAPPAQPDAMRNTDSKK